MELAVDHLIKKSHYEAKIKAKLPYGHGRGTVPSETEYKKEYTPKDGEAADQLKTPDNINFGELRFFDQAQKLHYKDHTGDDQVKEAHDRNHGLKLNIKQDGKFGHLFKNKEEHNDKYNRDKDGLKEGAVEKPGKWISGKLVRKEHKFDGNTTSKLHYRGVSQDMVRQDERFDNLKNPKGMDVSNLTRYRKEHGGKSPDIVTNSQLHGLNKDFDRKTLQTFKQPDWKNDSTYKRDYSANVSRMDPAKSHVGRDDNMRNYLNQYHQGYYYVDK